MNDLASGTSSGSTKLIHGGLRYLEHYEFRLVREALMEREVLWTNGAAHHLAAALRAAVRQGPAPGLAAAARPVPLRPSRRPQAAAGDQDARHAQRPGRQAAEAAVHQGVRIFRLLGQRCAPGGAQRPRRGRPRRHRSAPAPRWSRRAPRRRASGRSRVEDLRSRQTRDGEGAAARQRRRPVGRPCAVRARSARTTSTMSGWCRAATSSCRRSSTIRAPISSRTRMAASSSPSPTRTISR